MVAHNKYDLKLNKNTNHTKDIRKFPNKPAFVRTIQEYRVIKIELRWGKVVRRLDGYLSYSLCSESIPTPMLVINPPIAIPKTIQPIAKIQVAGISLPSFQPTLMHPAQGWTEPINRRKYPAVCGP